MQRVAILGMLPSQLLCGGLHASSVQRVGDAADAPQTCR